jgi:hypothetical protein
MKGVRLTLDELCEYMSEQNDEIATTMVEEWTQVNEEEPWFAVPRDIDCDHLPQMISCLTDVALCTFFDEEKRYALVHSAAIHGEHRKSQNFSEAVVHREYALLRRSLWSLLKEHLEDRGAAATAMVRLDTALQLAAAASLRGYFRETLETHGQWPEALEALARDWIFPGTASRE